MNKKKVILAALLIFTSTGSIFGQDNQNFEAILKKHLDAIVNRDINGIAATVDDNVLLIFPDGDTISTKEKFIAFHKDWFKDSLWKMTTSIQKTVKTESLCYALVKYQITKYKPDATIASQSNTFLLLIFKKEKQNWLLIHDQNTKLSL